jgi:hypothetical protein
MNLFWRTNEISYAARCGLIFRYQNVTERMQANEKTRGIAWCLGATFR